MEPDFNGSGRPAAGFRACRRYAQFHQDSEGAEPAARDGLARRPATGAAHGRASVAPDHPARAADPGWADAARTQPQLARGRGCDRRAIPQGSHRDRGAPERRRTEPDRAAARGARVAGILRALSERTGGAGVDRPADRSGSGGRGLRDPCGSVGQHKSRRPAARRADADQLRQPCLSGEAWCAECPRGFAEALGDRLCIGRRCADCRLGVSKRRANHQYADAQPRCREQCGNLYRLLPVGPGADPDSALRRAGAHRSG